MLSNSSKFNQDNIVLVELAMSGCLMWKCDQITKLFKLLLTFSKTLVLVKTRVKDKDLG